MYYITLCKTNVMNHENFVHKTFVYNNCFKSLHIEFVFKFVYKKLDLNRLPDIVTYCCCLSSLPCNNTVWSSKVFKRSNLHKIELKTILSSNLNKIKHNMPVVHSGIFIVVKVKLKAQPFVRDGTKDCFNRTSTMKKLLLSKFFPIPFKLVVL